MGKSFLRGGANLYSGVVAGVVVKYFCRVRLCYSMDCGTPAGFPVHHYLPKLAQTHVHWVGDAIQPPVIPLSCRQSFLASGPFPKGELFAKRPKYWSFSFSISPSNEYSGLISFRMDWFDLLAVHGTLKSLLQHHSLKASVLQCSAFFMVQLSHLYVTTEKKS